jgi:tRNA-splicing ligase RtcB
MFEYFIQDTMHLPIRIWLDSIHQVDDVCLQQAKNLSNLKVLEGWVALMPDTHQGFGMPIGGVIAAKGHVIPNAVGVDIGCGVAFIETSLTRDKLKSFQAKKIVEALLAVVPVGFKHHKQRQTNRRLEQLVSNQELDLKKNHLLYQEIERSFYQLGTLGSGNHFIELQEDESGKIYVMLHTGSRNFGLKIANYYNDKAEYYCKKNNDRHAYKTKLSYLPVESESGEHYIRWMTMGLEFAKENRAILLQRVQETLSTLFSGVEFKGAINTHHNYVALENHLNQSLWIHRKGAIRAHKGEKGIIPGAMGSYSYIVEGLGNADSFSSCSHGAGRHLSRKEALKKFNKTDIIAALEHEGITVGVPKESLLADETREAYKDIESVMEAQKDLVKPLLKLKTVLVVKG